VPWGIQNTIDALSGAAADAGDHGRGQIKKPWDAPVTSNPLVGELGVALGHGTFIAGIFRQVVPDARVLSIRIMHSDDVVNEGDLIEALKLLAARVKRAQRDDQPDLTVDAISLSIGYYDECSADVAYSSGLWTVIKKLLDLGVLVIAAAGNNSSRRRFYPAAFAAQPRPDELPVLSVGALNPYRSRAMFSDDGGWVSAWASGAAVISTFPNDVRGSVMSQVRQDDGRRMRETLNPDDFRGGFAQWSGTSFAAPALAAQFLKAMAETARNGGSQAGASWLTTVSAPATRERAINALDAIGWKGD
jgi:hypothetical protein